MSRHDARMVPEFDALRERSLASIRRHERRRRIGMRVGVWSGAAVLVLGGTGAVWTVIASEELREHSAACYDAQDLDSRHNDIGSVDPGAMDRTELALSMCEAAWRQGFAGPHGQDAPPDGVDNPVPRLYACLQPNGVIAVFPYENDMRRTCGHLGLSEPNQ